jgi:multidrug resistance efflux pump
MAGKMFKRIAIIILIVACLFNIVNKLVKRNSFKTELESAATYVETIGNDVSGRIENVTDKNSN